MQRRVWIFSVLLLSNMAAAYSVKNYQAKKEVTALCQMDKSVWIATQSGLVLFDKTENTYKLADHPVLNTMHITDLEPHWASKVLYVSGSPEGVFGYYPASNKLSPAIKLQKKQRVWRMDRSGSKLAVCYGKVGTGLDILDLKSGSIERVANLDTVNVYNVAWDDTTLWALGLNTIHKYDNRSKKLQSFSAKDKKYRFLRYHSFEDYSDIQTGDDYVAFIGNGRSRGSPVLYTKSIDSLSEGHVIKDSDYPLNGMLSIPLRRKGELYWIRSSYDVYAPSGYATHYVFDVADRSDLIKFGGRGFHTCTLKDGFVLWLGTTTGLYRLDYMRMKLSFIAFEPVFQDFRNAYAAKKNKLLLASVKPVDARYDDGSQKPKYLFNQFDLSTGRNEVQSQIQETTPVGWKKIQIFAEQAGIDYPVLKKHNPPRFTYPENRRYNNKEDLYDDYNIFSRKLNYHANMAFAFFQDNLYIGGLDTKAHHYESNTEYFCAKITLNDGAIRPLYPGTRDLISDKISGLEVIGNILYFGTSKGLSACDLIKKSWHQLKVTNGITHLENLGSELFAVVSNKLHRVNRDKLAFEKEILPRVTKICNLGDVLVVWNQNFHLLFKGAENTIKAKTESKTEKRQLVKLVPRDKKSFWAMYNNGHTLYSIKCKGPKDNRCRLQAKPVEYQFHIASHPVSIQSKLAHNKIRFAMSSELPPLHFRTAPDKEIQGFEADLARMIGKKLSYSVEFVDPKSYGMSSYDCLMWGKADVILNAWTVTEARKKAVSFTQPYLKTGLGLLVRNKEFAEPSIIGVVKGVKAEKIARKQFKRAKIKMFDHSEACIIALKDKEIEAVVSDEVFLRSQLKNNGMPGWAMSDKLLTSESYAAATLWENEMHRKINEVLKELEKKGEIKKLTEKWIR